MPEDVILIGSPDGDEALGPRCLLIAIDETGHEELADPKYPIFGLGGCLTVVGDYHNQIRGPWSSLKREHFGGPKFRSTLQVPAFRPLRRGQWAPSFASATLDVSLSSQRLTPH